MKICIFLLLLLLLVITPTRSAEQQESNPTLVFFVDHENEPSKDYVEITLQIQSKDSSLTTAINTAAFTVQQISQIAKDFCIENAKKKSQCKQIIDAGKFQVEPRYQVIRKQPVFMGFTVNHQMSIIVRSVDNIGYLVDKILTKSGITLENFEWKAEQQPKTHEQAIAQGMEEGEGLCKQLGLELGRILSIEQINEDQAEEQKPAEQQQREDQQEQQEAPEATVFRFQVQCQQLSKDSKNKNQ